MPARPLPNRVLSGHRVSLCPNPRDKKSVVVVGMDAQISPYLSQDVWIEDVTFVAPCADGPGMIGTLIRARSAAVTKKNGWTRVRLDGAHTNGCFYDMDDGACVQTAKYAWFHKGRLLAFGALDSLRGPSLSSMALAGPARRQWTGDMGGLNFDMPTPERTMTAVADTLARHPGSMILDGADDWYAPLAVRPAALAQRYGTPLVCLWHTGTSGQIPSGVVMHARNFDRFSSQYRNEFGHDIDKIPGTKPPSDTERPCGCWAEQGVLIYR